MASASVIKIIPAGFAVTDSKLRVIGVTNLRVADSSVYPSTPSGNLQAPTIMVAERAAAFIKEDWS